MKGCRPLDELELKKVLASFHGPSATRYRALVLVGVRAGFRISEILSLRVGEVLQSGRLVEAVTVERRHMKGKTEGRTVVLHPEAREAIGRLLDEMAAAAGGELSPTVPLFQGRRGGDRPISRVQAWRVLKRAFRSSRLTGRLGTQSLRKTFAERVYLKLGRDLVKTQKALGHRWITSTVAYLSFADEDIDQAILNI